MQTKPKSLAIPSRTRKKGHLHLAKALRPPPNVPISEFSERERVLSSEVAAASGRWKNIGYQVEMQDAIKPGKIVTYITSSQVGKTESILNLLLYWMLNETGGINFVLPSESMATEFSKARIAPLVRDTPKLRALIGDARKDGNSQLFRKYPSGYLRLTGTKADRLSSFGAPLACADEIDRMPRNAINSGGTYEGKPLLLLLERFKNWPNRRALLTGTPTIDGASEIQSWWLKSDQRIPLIPCPHSDCDNEIFLDFLNIFNRPDWGTFTWTGKDNDEETDAKSIAFQCGKCSRHFNESDYDKWSVRPNWIKLNPGAENPGFHINAFYSPWTTWSSLLEKFIEAGKNPMKLMTFWNTTGGWPFSFEAIKTPEWQELATRKHEYERYQVPNDAKILLAACDVQFDRLECSVWAFNRKQAYLITHEAFSGNTSNIDDECWGELDAFIHKEWVKQNGIKIRIHKCAIDAHYNTNQVANYARKRKRVVPVTGIDTNWQADILPSRPIDIKRNGKFFRTGKRRWPIGVSVVKLDLYARLKLQPADDGTLPAEYVRFPSGMPEEYYKQLTGEVCKLEEDARGNAKMVWEKQYDAVETLDCAVYALALYKICGFHLWADERWDRL